MSNRVGAPILIVRQTTWNQSLSSLTKNPTRPVPACDLRRYPASFARGESLGLAALDLLMHVS